MSTSDYTVVYLGNRKAVEVLDDPNDLAAATAEDRAPAKIRAELPGKRATTVVIPAGTSLMDAAREITHSTAGVWQAHSDADSPAWVASTNPELAKLLSTHWGCELRDPAPEPVAGDDAVEPAPAKKGR